MKRFLYLTLFTLLLASCKPSTASPLPPTPAQSATPNPIARDATAGAMERVTRQAQLTRAAIATATQSALETSRAFEATRNARQTAEAAELLAAQATVRAWPQWPPSLTETFEDNRNGWRVGRFSNTTLTYNLTPGGGQYTWQVDSAEDLILTACPAGGITFTDFHALAEGWFDPDSGAALFGIVFRLQNEENFYFFGLSNSGTPRFTVVQDGGRESLLFDEISSTEGVKRLEVYARGSQFIFLVDGQVVGFTNERRFAWGQVGLGAFAFQQGDAIQVGFRLFEVRSPAR